MTVKFNASRRELTLIGAIVQRARSATPAAASVTPTSELVMSMDACRSNGCPLDLERMAEWERDFDIVHDVYGIDQHINKDTGKLEGFFTPRFAKKETKHGN